MAQSVIAHMFPSYICLVIKNRPITMQDSVTLSAKMPTTRRARKGISDAQKQALRVYASETYPTPSQRACVEWFRY
jgi:hypothetical protein